MKKWALIVIALVVVGTLACNGTAQTPTKEPTVTCPPTPTCAETSALETRLAACEATLTAVAEENGPPPTDSPPTCAYIPCAQAGECIGEQATVHGTVVDTSYRTDVGGQPTFLNFCRPYPDHCFTALIWGDHRQNFIGCLGGEPEDVLLNRQVSVTGLIEEYKGKPQIILRSCDQLEVLQ